MAREMIPPPVLAGLNSFSDQEIGCCVREHGLLSMWIEPSLFCNYSCVYCYTFSNEQTHDEIPFSKLVSIVHEAVDVGLKSVIISGGEPIAYSGLRALIGELRRQGVVPVIFTNGSYMDRELATFFYKNECSILVKLDSREDKVQDYLTGSVGSAAASRRTIEHLMALPFNVDRQSLRLGIASVITQHNLREMPDLWRYCREHVLFPHLEPIGYEGRAKSKFSELAIAPAQARQLYDALLEIDEQECGITWNRWSALPAMNCKQLLYSLNISARGVATVCNGIAEPLGDLDKLKLTQVLRSRALRKMRHIHEHAQTPPDLQMGNCYGCRARAYNLTGDMYAADPVWQPASSSTGVSR